MVRFMPGGACPLLAQMSSAHFQRLNALFGVILHTVDDAAYCVGFHQCGVIGFQQSLKERLFVPAREGAACGGSAGCVDISIA
jgi:hypothetical protein